MNIADQKKDATYINKLNKITVLNLIRESERISRAEIVKVTKLSAPTITRIVDGLINDQLVTMVGEGSSTGGRRPKMIRFIGQYNYVIGVDLGSTNIRAGIADLEGKLITEIEMPTKLNEGFEKVCGQVGDLISKLINRSKIEEDKILGIGLAVAGLISLESGVVEYSPAFGWRKVNLREELAKYTSIPIYYDNVTRVTALGELLYGAGKEYKNFICVNVGYGIGAAIVADGNLFVGSRGFTGELGHIIVDKASDYVGKDGIVGCLEALSSGYGIAAIAKIKIEEGTSTSILTYVDGEIDKLDAKAVIDAAKDGDALAFAIFDEAMKNLALGLDTIFKLLDPKAIVFAGGLSLSGDIFFDTISKHISESFTRMTDIEVPLLRSFFMEDAALMGAFSLVISKVLNFETPPN